MKYTSGILIAFIISLSLINPVISSPLDETKGFTKFQVTPKDDSITDKDFSPFIIKFKKDVKERNIESLKKSIAPDISWTFGEESGVKSFLAWWKLGRNPKNSDFWNEMEKVLSMGSAFYNEEKTSHAFPYLFVTFPAEYDSFVFAAVTGKKVNVRKSPSAKSSVIETLDYEIVKPIVTGPDSKKEKIGGVNGTWIKVITSSGKEGYIFSQFVQSPIGYRAIFEKRGKSWMLTAFISGD